MSANTQPIFPLTPKIGRAVLTAADTSFTAPTTAGQQIFAAGNNGSRLDGIKIRALGTNVATVLRLFLFDGTNYTLVHEIALAASTAATSGITGADTYLLPVNYDNGMAGNSNGVIPPYLPVGYKLYASLGTTVAAGYAVTAWGGDY